MQSLTNDNGYYRAMIANKLVNYASEINGKLIASLFKQLVSGEPVEARLPYGRPFTLTSMQSLYLIVMSYLKMWSKQRPTLGGF